MNKRVFDTTVKGIGRKKTIVKFLDIESCETQTLKIKKCRILILISLMFAKLPVPGGLGLPPLVLKPGGIRLSLPEFNSFFPPILN